MFQSILNFFLYENTLGDYLIAAVFYTLPSILVILSILTLFRIHRIRKSWIHTIGEISSTKRTGISNIVPIVKYNDLDGNPHKFESSMYSPTWTTPGHKIKVWYNPLNKKEGIIDSWETSAFPILLLLFSLPFFLVSIYAMITYFGFSTN